MHLTAHRFRLSAPLDTEYLDFKRAEKWFSELLLAGADRNFYVYTAVRADRQHDVMEVSVIDTRECNEPSYFELHGLTANQSRGLLDEYRDYRGEKR